MRWLWILTAMSVVGCGSSASSRAREEVGAAKAAMARGSDEAALEHLDASIGIQPTVEAYLLRSQIHFSRARLGLALDDVKAGLAIEKTDESLLNQKKIVDEALREFDERQAQRKAADKQNERDALERLAALEREQVSRERQRAAKEVHDSLVNDLRFLLTDYEDYWAAVGNDEREAYIAKIEAQGEQRLKAEIAGRKAYWDDRYRSSDDPGTPEQEEKKAREFVERQRAR